MQKFEVNGRTVVFIVDYNKLNELSVMGNSFDKRLKKLQKYFSKGILFEGFYIVI